MLQIFNLSFSYQDQSLFHGLNLSLSSPEVVAIIGDNGAGKSTLLRIILSQVTADSGRVWLASGLSIGYIAQDLVNFDLARSFLAQNPSLGKTEVYQAAATMDFVPSDLQKAVGNLSRGQITKLAILKLILRPLDLVILDEITNHLDIRARENIESALKNYHGAILVATHDETFAREINLQRKIIL